MNKSTVASFIPLIILSLVTILSISSSGSVLCWSESDVNTAFKLVGQDAKNDYPGGGSENSSSGFGYRIEEKRVDSKGGYIRLTMMNRPLHRTKRCVPP